MARFICPEAAKRMELGFEVEVKAPSRNKAKHALCRRCFVDYKECNALQEIPDATPGQLSLFGEVE